MKIVLTCVATLMASQAGMAQWLNYPDAGVPRGKDGKVIMTAPVQRLSDGKPDLSGVWSPDTLNYLT